MLTYRQTEVNKMAHNHGLYFKFFLGIYAIFLLSHISSLELGSVPVMAAITAGLVIALAAHARHSYGTIVLLVIHMILEWSYHAERWWAYDTRELALYGMHTILDCTFLWIESRAHFRRYYPLFLVSVAVVIGIVVKMNYQPAPISPLWRELAKNGLMHAHTHVGILGPLVLGGIVGCVFSHLMTRARAIDP